MEFQMSPNVAIRTNQVSEAVHFYTNVLGFPIRSHTPDLTDIDADPKNLFILQDDDIRGPVMELFVPDLEEAKAHLVANGCVILRWRGKGQDCYVRDPFGVVFNIWETG